MPAVVPLGEPFFELPDFLSVESAPFSATQRGEHPLFVGLVEDGPTGKRTVSSGMAPEQRKLL